MVNAVWQAFSLHDLETKEMCECHSVDKRYTGVIVYMSNHRIEERSFNEHCSTN